MLLFYNIVSPSAHANIGHLEYEEIWEVRIAHSFKMSKQVITVVIQKSRKFQCLPSSYLFSLESFFQKKKKKEHALAGSVSVSLIQKPTAVSQRSH